MAYGAVFAREPFVVRGHTLLVKKPLTHLATWTWRVEKKSDSSIIHNSTGVLSSADTHELSDIDTAYATDTDYILKIYSGNFVAVIDSASFSVIEPYANITGFATINAAIEDALGLCLYNSDLVFDTFDVSGEWATATLTIYTDSAKTVVSKTYKFKRWFDSSKQLSSELGYED